MIADAWRAFAEKPVEDFEAPAPALELATVLERHHTDMDAAARAAAQGRERGLHGLAEVAVLAVDLENLLERSGGAWSAALRVLKDQMLADIAAAGLEIVRLRGLPARATVDLVDVESWRYDDAYAEAVVVEELAVAVRHLGRPLRRGRVVMGAPQSGGPRTTDDGRARASRSAAAEAHPQRPVATVPGSILCPVTSCRHPNAPDADVCAACLTQLVVYRRFSQFPQVLFNRGLQAARSSDPTGARDQFAAALAWAPEDTEVRNAYALACFEADDEPAARRAWEEVLERMPTDARALAGLSRLSKR
ncbi:hypothetical protein C8N24_3693 [Solirubrobacter pauli]|uniref:Tetratricopeptide repeat protein n=1 Tax=Solirubrobacter pauli TaxID=166793 RepID=A0A660LGN6_9ACTN|nr:tetratricopeptide repeat protein [Solirubrobacter pauli]RKQ93819.1 hypothetical protein C8N24_3693 [Solirubrobacter pauli]